MPVRLFVLLLTLTLALWSRAGFCETGESDSSTSHTATSSDAAPVGASAHEMLPELHPHAHATTGSLHGEATSGTLLSRPPAYPFLLNSKYEWQSLHDGLWIRDIHIGKGKMPSRGVAVYLNIKGRLEDGTVFMDTKKKKLWFCYTYGRGEVLESLDEAIATMREGGKRTVVIPSELAYGEEGYDEPTAGAVDIPPNANLTFEITFLWLREPEFNRLNLFK